MLTEDEAKTKWCPQSSYAWPSGVASNRGGANDQHPDFVHATRCIGSACMSWRWQSYFRPGSGWDDPSKEKAGYEGFCGLAGRPQ